MLRSGRRAAVSLDPLTALAFAVRSSPGTYALLIGSGVSTAAGIPTGWAIVLDLIRRIAATEGVDPGEDLERWYLERFGEAPTYSSLLNLVAKTPAERQALVRSYIEPDEEQRRSDLRVPTNAHRSIARLVLGGYIQVILTTNFDRLLEQAIEEAGVPVDVIDCVDALAGARPLGQSRCVLIKLHGDYRDARIRNTPAELASYEPEIDRLLDRILDEHGLIVCSWSANWDEALRNAITRQPNRRYTTYWAARGEPSEGGAALIARRGADVIRDADAEQLFTQLERKVLALAELDRPHPLSVGTAVAELKRYLADPQARIQLDDLLRAEADRAFEAISDAHFPVGGPYVLEEAQRRIARYGAAVEILIALFVAGCYYTRGGEQARLWARALERVLNHEGAQAGLVAYIAMRRYPALLLFYAAGIAALASENWEVIQELFVGGEYREPMHSVQMPFLAALHPWLAFDNAAPQPVLLPQATGQRHTPISDYLHDVLREPLRAVIPSDARYEEFFDRFEFLVGTATFDLHEHKQGDYYMLRALVGRFGWKYSHGLRGSPVEWAQTIIALGASAPPLRAGLFAGDPTRFETAAQTVVEAANAKGWGW